MLLGESSEKQRHTNNSPPGNNGKPEEETCDVVGILGKLHKRGNIFLALKQFTRQEKGRTFKA